MQFLLILITLATSSVHELHLSMCSVTYNLEAERLEVQQRIFYDDLEKSLKVSLEDEKFDILKPEDSKLNYDSLLLAYVNENIDFSINGEDSQLSLLEYEIRDDALILFLYKVNVKELNALKIHSHILFELFQDQDNVLSVNAYGQKKSHRFSVDSKPFEIDF